MLLAAVLCPMAAAQQAKPGSAATAAGEARPSQMPENALPGAQAVLLGQIVEQVRVPSAGARQAQLLDKIPLKSGDRLGRRNLRDSLRALYESGRFVEVEADANRLPSGGVSIEFRTKPNYFNANVTVTGIPKIGPNETQVVNTGRLELGTLFTEEKLAESEGRILQLLHEHGYWKAQVGAKLTRHEETQQVDVEFQLLAGELARVGKLTVAGDAGLSPDAAMEVCRLHPGMRVRADLMEHALARLRKRYVKQLRLRAQLTAGLPLFQAESNTVDYSITVEPGPVVEVPRRGRAAEPLHPEALHSGIRGTRRGRRPAERGTAGPARLFAGAGIL